MKEGKKPSELYPQVAECEEKLNQLIQEIINVGKEMFTVSKGLYMTDIFLMGVMNRSINLIDAILCLTNRWNFIAAGPLVRLHLDTLLRLSYLRASNNPDLFIRQVLEGKRLDKVKDEEGKELKDIRLRDYTRPIFPQVDNVYKETSRLIHFSDKHVFTCIEALDDTGRTAGFSVGKGSPKWREKDILSLLRCAIVITEAILAIVRGWVLEKAQITNLGDEKQ
ncbi:unnamed protein product [marine sediment metagenome]|uniref:Uncharacterized protein n=1 Tax=marine sediment metagenome TaxID=412755 RepID=X1K3H9_9ZZZZ